MIAEVAESPLSPKSKLSFKSRKTANSKKSFNRSNTNQSTKTVSTLGGDKKKHVILDEGKAERITGQLKFFDDKKNYGFLTIDSSGKDIFVHFGDLNKAGLSRSQLNDSKTWKDCKFEFTALTYIGKHNKSKKAVDLMMIK